MFRVSSILIGLLATLSVQASAASNELSSAGIAEFTAAYQAWDGARFAAAAELFRRATTNAPTNVTNFYWLGSAQFHRMVQLQNAPANRTNKAAAKAALQTLLKAEKLFEMEAKATAAPLHPRWGYDSCLTLLGRTYELLGQRKEAVDSFRRALAMHPADHLAKEGLKRASEHK